MINHSYALAKSNPHYLSSYPSLRDELFSPLESVFDSFFDSFFKGTTAIDKVRSSGTFPKMNVFVDNNQLNVHCAVPGMSTDDIQVVCKDNVLKISGKLEETKTETANDKKYFIKELSYRSFSREVLLPDWVKEQPDAILKDGILKLTWEMPEVKKKEEPKLISIPIKTG